VGSALHDVSAWAVPAFLLLIPVYAFFRRVRLYEAFIRGAEEGVGMAVRIMPYLLAMMMAVSIFRHGGAMGMLSRVLGPVFGAIGIPVELVPLALMRPFSGGGALGVTAEIIGAYGPDSLIGRMASTMQGSTDTTFFVLAVYFGSVGVKQYRYSLAVGLMADLTTFLASVYIVQAVFG